MKKRKNSDGTPSPKELREAREALKLSQEEAAAVIYHKARGWRYLEAGARTLHRALWELWCIKTGYRPNA